MDERDRERQLVDTRAEGTGSPRLAVEVAKGGVEDALWFVRRRLAWPLADALGSFEPRGLVGVLGGGGIAVAGVVAALVIAGPGAGSGAGTTEAFVAPPRLPTHAVPTRPPRAKVKKPTGPTLHGAPPDFSPVKDAKAGLGSGKAVGGGRQTHGGGGVKAAAGGPAPDVKAASAVDAPAATAKIASTPAATASAVARTDSLSGGERDAVGTPAGPDAGTSGGSEAGAKPNGPPAPKAAKRVARRFAESFVVYEIGRTDEAVRQAFDATTTKQLSRALLRRPPRQPANVKVPKAKVVNIVAGPSRGSVYTLSVALLRVGVTSELRLQMERGVGGKWQVTNVLG